jgi:hypothetical protein
MHQFTFLATLATTWLLLLPAGMTQAATQRATLEAQYIHHDDDDVIGTQVVSLTVVGLYDDVTNQMTRQESMLLKVGVNRRCWDQVEGSPSFVSATLIDPPTPQIMPYPDRQAGDWTYSYAGATSECFEFKPIWTPIGMKVAVDADKDGLWLRSVPGNDPWTWEPEYLPIISGPWIRTIQVRPIVIEEPPPPMPEPNAGVLMLTGIALCLRWSRTHPGTRPSAGDLLP